MAGPTTRLRLRVSPRSSRTGVGGFHAGAWRVRVSAPPESGKANAAVLDVLARALDVPRRRLEIVAGPAAREKVVAVHGLAEHEVEARLAAATEASAR
ncbi:MAG TPA: DUF167 domain-containing protein [Gaiellaceae bacterium]|nr:DUF167 domain-containing protein [Gaiellaceae bacterium]